LPVRIPSIIASTGGFIPPVYIPRGKRMVCSAGPSRTMGDSMNPQAEIRGGPPSARKIISQFRKVQPENVLPSRMTFSFSKSLSRNSIVTLRPIRRKGTSRLLRVLARFDVPTLKGRYARHALFLFGKSHNIAAQSHLAFFPTQLS